MVYLTRNDTSIQNYTFDYLQDVFGHKYLHPYILPKIKRLLGIKTPFEALEDFLKSTKKWPPPCTKSTEVSVMVGRTPLTSSRSNTLPLGDSRRKRSTGVDPRGGGGAAGVSSTLPLSDIRRKRSTSERGDEMRRSFVEVYVTGDSIVKLEDKAEEMMDGMLQEHKEILEDKQKLEALAHSPEFIQLRNVSTL